MHRDNEFVVVEDVQNAYDLGVRIVNELGENKYSRPKQKEVTPWWKRSQSNYGHAYGYGQHSNYNPHQGETKQNLLNEGVDGEEIWDEWDDFFGEGYDWEDNFDYEDFNGGYEIIHYGTEDTPDYDW